MSFKEKLEKLKIKILTSSLSDNKNYEFQAELEDHQIGNQNIYRLHYIDYHRIGKYYERTDNNVGIIDWPFTPFILPDGMSREDGFKVLSYLTDFERLGFKRVNTDISDSDVIDLFTVSGRLLLFKHSKYYQKYFEWYTENITFNEIKEIYDKCSIEFYDLILSENSEKSNIEYSNDRSKLVKKR